MFNAAFKNKGLSRKITLALVAAYFLVACILFLDRLELNNDESIMGIGALALITPGVPTTMLRHVNSLVMFSPHKGKAAAFPAALLFTLFGKSVFVLRFTQVLFSLGTLFCVYYVCKRQFGDTVGLLTFFLLGVDSNFIRTTRIGYLQDAVFQIFLFWLGLSLVQLYLDKRRKNYLYCSAFIFGVALWAKLMALGYFLGIAAASLLFWRKSYAFFKTRVFGTKQVIVFFLFSFILGYAPALIFNAAHDWPTLHSVSNSFKPLNANIRWNNLDFLNNLKIRMGNFNELLTNSNVADAITMPVNGLSLPLFYFSLSAVLLYIFLRKSKAIKRSFSENKILFFLGVYSALLVLSCFIPSSGSFDSTNVTIMLPSIQLVEALFFGLLLVYLKVKFWPYAVSLCLLLPYTAAEANIMRQLWLDLG
ncbi:MAG: glycosyltransferase family 39 protein, partial [Candidatus Omnitrophica bacterium]|nr:glycosyltransferase family 39 protein [Candidatus Omnitrophota bacterium]